MHRNHTHIIDTVCEFFNVAPVGSWWLWDVVDSFPWVHSSCSFLICANVSVPTGDQVDPHHGPCHLYRLNGTKHHHTDDDAVDNDDNGEDDDDNDNEDVNGDDDGDDDDDDDDDDDGDDDDGDDDDDDDDDEDEDDDDDADQD